MVNIIGKETRRFWMGVAIIVVFLYHLIFFSVGQIEFPHWFNLLVSPPVGNGWLGVDIFLFLSAYGLCHSYEKNSLSTFYLNRIRRIIPIYFVFAIVVTIFFLKSESPLEIATDWLKQMTGLAVFKPFGNPDHIEWFTPALILMYLFFPLIYKTVKWTSVRPLVLGLFIILAVLGVNLLTRFISVNLATRIPAIIAGVATYFFLSHNEKRRMITFFTFMAILSFMSTHWMMQMCLCIPLVLYGLDKVNITHSQITDFVSFAGFYSFEIYLAQEVTTRYILTGEGEYFSKLIWCVVLTPFMSWFFIIASKSINRLKSLSILKLIG